MFGMDEGEGLNVGRKNEFFEGKMGQTERNVGCPEGENIASERDRLRAMEMAGQLECGGTSNVEVDSGGSSQCDTRQKTGKDGQTERKARCRAPAPTGENDLKSDTQGETGETGRMEREPGSGGDAPAEASCMGTVSAGKNDLKSDTRREQGQTGQLERELGCRGSPPAELGCRGTAPAAVADAEEVLAALTRILRGEEEAKTSEVLRAAELLGKQYGLFGDREGAPTEAPKIVMDVPGRGEKK